ncbi:MAG: DUF4430 domain-containing protein [Tyzzerella sp.]|nr:DUF4430 domain-containing protein [Tyzzerella sp.]
MNKKKVILGSGILVVLIVAMTLIWTNFREKPVEGSKAITIEVVDSKGKSTVYELKTNAKYLINAMDEAKEQGLSYEGEEGPYGLSISKVNGERADYTLDGAYWGFNVNGEYCNLGVSKQPVEDGDEFEIVYTKAE